MEMQSVLQFSAKLDQTRHCFAGRKTKRRGFGPRLESVQRRLGRAPLTGRDALPRVQADRHHLHRVGAAGNPATMTGPVRVKKFAAGFVHPFVGVRAEADALRPQRVRGQPLVPKTVEERQRRAERRHQRRPFLTDIATTRRQIRPVQRKSLGHGLFCHTFRIVRLQN